MTQSVSQLVSDMGRLWSDLGPIKKGEETTWVGNCSKVSWQASSPRCTVHLRRILFLISLSFSIICSLVSCSVNIICFNNGDADEDYTLQISPTFSFPGLVTTINRIYASLANCRRQASWYEGSYLLIWYLPPSLTLGNTMQSLSETLSHST